MLKRNRTDRTNRHRQGVLSMELVLTLPILATLLFGLFEFSLLFFARAEVVEACRAGARKATLHGATQGEVEADIRAALSPRMERGLEVAAELDGETGDMVSVGVRVPMSSAAPDLLWPIGFSLEGRDLQCVTTMARE